MSRFYDWLGRSPDTATAEDLRRYQLHLVDHGISPISLNVTITGLKFFFESTLDHPELMRHMHPVHTPRKIPVVLSPEEVARLISAAGSLRNQTALSVAYGAGLRVSEVVALKVSDIDSQRMALRIEQGKGSKDRYAMLSPELLDCLRTWWRPARQSSVLLARANKVLYGKEHLCSWRPSQTRGCAYQLNARQRFDDEHRRTTVWADEGGLSGFARCLVAIRCFNRRCDMQQFACPRQVLTAPTVRDQPIVADAMKPARQYMQQYETEQSLSDRFLYAGAEDEARLMVRGLWQDPHPAPPWAWRKQKRGR